MAKVVTPVVCKVIIIGRPKESTFTPGQVYYPVLFADTSYPEGHEDAKIWKNLSGDEVTQIQKGDMVQLVPIGVDKNGRDKHQIVVITPLPSVREQAVADHHQRTLKPTGMWSDEQKRAIAGKVAQEAKLMRFCLETAKAQFGDLVESEESLRSLATTLFIQALRG